MKRVVFIATGIASLVLTASSFATPAASSSAYEPEYYREENSYGREHRNSYYGNSEERDDYNYIRDNWNLEQYENFLRDFPNSQFAPEIRARVNEIKLWEQTVRTNTEASYQNYLDNSRYGHYSSQAREAIAAIKQEVLDREWRTTCGINTKAAYQDFISRFPDASQVAQARARIRNIEEQEEWDKIKNSYDVNALQDFILRHPDFENIDYAQSRLHALRMENYLDTNDIDRAANEYEYITVMEAVPETSRFALGIVQEYDTYKKLSSRSPESELQDFIRKYPGSQYLVDVKNYLALNKASKFTTASTKLDYDTALSYATGSTRTAVQQAIKSNDKRISTEKAWTRKMNRAKNGGWVGMLFEYGDISWNGRSTNGLVNYNLGIKFRIGNYTDRVQFAIGAKPGIGIWDFDGIYATDDYGNDNERASAFFELPLEASLKANVCRSGSDAWFFVQGCFDYNIVREKKVERPMGFRVGLGWAGYSWDVFFYYGMELGNIDCEYSFLNGLPNPFMDKKTANYFGLSVAATVKLF